LRAAVVALTGRYRDSVTPPLQWRSLNVDDFDQWMVLLHAIETFDREHERTVRSDVDRLAEDWKLDVNSIGAFAADGTLLGYGRNGCRPGATDAITVYLAGGVHPEARGQGLGQKVLEWQLDRAVHNVTELRAIDPAATNLPPVAGWFVEEQVDSRARLFAAAGFTQTRWFLELQRPLTAAIALPPLPDGLVYLQFTDDLSERTRVSHNAAFADHYNPHPYTAEDWVLRGTSDPAFRPAMSYVIVDQLAEGQPVVAYACNHEYVEDWADQGFTDGYTGLLGVVRERRGQGLAKYLLDMTANAFLNAGHTVATLTVDADSATGATDLYFSQGYVSKHRTSFYSLGL
jgi:mycothiol synthase